MPHFDGFRLRWCSKPLPKPTPPIENDSDHSSSPERVERCVSLHIPASKNARRSTDRAPNLHKTLPTTNKTKSNSRLSHDDEVLNEKSSTHHLESPVEATDKAVSLLRSTTNIHKSSPPAMKPSLVRRVTSKLRITVPATTSSSQAMSAARSSHSRDEEKHFSRPPPRTTLRHSSTLPNSFVSREKREAALRERGLRPPRKDLSEQEREADERLGPAPLPKQGESSAASKIKEEWLFMNRSTEASDPGSTFYPHQLNFSALASGVAPLSHSVSQPLPRNSTCDSDGTRADLKTEIPLIGRSSISNSLSPLSQSSHLEVLQEEPAEHPPPLLRAQPPIVISTPIEDSNSPGLVDISESPVSCTFSSHLAPPGSFTDKENSGSPFPTPPARRRTTNSSNRSHASSVGTSLSKFGTGSLSNLRRSVIGSIRHSGSSADLSTSSSQPSSPRMAVSPTIHNRGSILFETKGIEDAESRRLSELAFLD